MSAHALTCPACLSPLRSNKPLPADKLLRCPQCGSQFTAIPPPVSRPFAPPPRAESPPPPEVALPEPAAPPASRTAPLIAAVAAASLLAVGGAVGAYFLFRERPPQPGPAVADDEGRKQQDEAQKKLDEERARLDQERKKLEAARLVMQADAAMAKKDYDAAAEAYDKATRLDPDNAEAKAGLTRARAEVQLAARARDDDARRQARYDELMDLGKRAMATKRYADAVNAFELALKVVPNDEAATRGLLRARAGVNDDAAQKKLLADYEEHMEAGRVAMNAGRYADAVKEFLAAQRAKPNDPAAVQAQQVAEKRLGDVQNKERKAAEYDRLMARAAAAMKEKQYDEAIKAYEAAAKLFPASASRSRGCARPGRRGRRGRTSSSAGWRRATWRCATSSWKRRCGPTRRRPGSTPRTRGPTGR